MQISCHINYTIDEESSQRLSHTHSLSMPCKLQLELAHSCMIFPPLFVNGVGWGSVLNDFTHIYQSEVLQRWWHKAHSFVVLHLYPSPLVTFHKTLSACELAASCQTLLFLSLSFISVCPFFISPRVYYSQQASPLLPFPFSLFFPC